MTRQVFFSFHYQRDIFRVNVVRQSGALDLVKGQGFYDHSLWEKTKLQGEAAIQRLIDGGMAGSSVAVALIGHETASRPWVRYELRKASDDGKGLLGIHIHNVRKPNGEPDSKGANPFTALGITDPAGGRVATYDWVNNNGYGNFPTWVEWAAKRAGR
jgi:hypothetical protein